VTNAHVAKVIVFMVLAATEKAPGIFLIPNQQNRPAVLKDVAADEDAQIARSKRHEC